MTARLAVARDRDPVGMRGAHVLSRRVRIRAREHVHAERAAARGERAERIALAQPLAAVVQRDRRGVVRDDAARAERGGVRVKAAEIIEPELRVEAAGIVFDQRELHPAHRPIEPAVRRGAGGGLRGHDVAGGTRERRERAGPGGHLQEVAAGDLVHRRHLGAARA